MTGATTQTPLGDEGETSQAQRDKCGVIPLTGGPEGQKHRARKWGGGEGCRGREGSVSWGHGFTSGR